MPKQDKKNLKLTWEKEKPNKYNEHFEQTLNNIYVAATMSVQLYARAGYTIKTLEKILEELKKLNAKK